MALAPMDDRYVPKIGVNKKTPSLMGEGLGEDGIIFWFPPDLILPPPPQPSPKKREGVLAILHATQKLGMMVLGAKAISCPELDMTRQPPHPILIFSDTMNFSLIPPPNHLSLSGSDLQVLPAR
jgi:hypothetical protein